MTIEWKEITDGCEAYNGEQWLFGRVVGEHTFASPGSRDVHAIAGGWICSLTNPTHYAPLTPIPEPAPKSTGDMCVREFLYIAQRVIEIGESEFPVYKLLDECVGPIRVSDLDACIKSARAEYKEKCK